MKALISKLCSIEVTRDMGLCNNLVILCNKTEKCPKKENNGYFDKDCLEDVV